MNRKAHLLASLFTATALYGGLFAMAPHIFLLRANSAAERLPFRVNLDFVEDAVTTRFDVPAEEAAAVSRPGSVRDLLERETKDLPIAELPLPDPLDAAELAERLGSEALDREHDLRPNEEMARSVEARILEISQKVARRDIEVARRFVRPSPDRLLGKDEMPVYRGVERAGDGSAIGLAGAGAGGGAGRGRAGAEAGPEPPAFERRVFLTEFEVAGLPELPDESLMAREFVHEAIKRESPFELMDQLVNAEATTYVDPDTGEGFFRLRIVPKEGEAIAVLPKDVTFVVDASNSISQRKLDLTVRGLKECLPGLRAGDRFNIIVFRDSPRLFREGLTAATPEAVADAQAFLDGLESRGSTDVYSAVEPAVAEPPRPGVPGLVLVLSDGRPTSGNLAGRNLINTLTGENTHGNTIYTFGGGNTVNRYLLDLLAYRNKGMTHVAPKIEDIDEHLPRFFGQLSDAFLVDLRADYGRIDRETVFPRVLPDFYSGRVVTVYGKFDPAQDEELVLRLEGRAEAVKKEIVLKASLLEASEGDRSVAQGWAFQKSYHLIGETTRVGETPELMDELHRLSEVYDVRTAYAH